MSSVASAKEDGTLGTSLELWMASHPYPNHREGKDVLRSF